MLGRRFFLKLTAGVVLIAAIQAPLAPARAENGGREGDGRDGDGRDGEGHDGDGRDGDHEGDGREGDGHDDNGHEDDGREDDGNDNGKGGGKGKRQRSLNQDEALRELKRGKIIPLKTALTIAGSEVPGKVIDVKLIKGAGGALYRIKIRRYNGAITTIRLDAKTGGFVGMLGF